MERVVLQIHCRIVPENVYIYTASTNKCMKVIIIMCAAKIWMTWHHLRQDLTDGKGLAAKRQNIHAEKCPLSPECACTGVVVILLQQGHLVNQDLCHKNSIMPLGWPYTTEVIKVFKNWSNVMMM